MSSYSPLFSDLPASRQDRWDGLAAFVGFWHHIDCPANDDLRTVPPTETRLEIALPPALMEWHTRFGQFIALRPECAHILPMNRLYSDNGALIIRSESVFEGRLEAKWGIPMADIAAEDPPVVSILRSRTYPCAESVSEFAIYCAMYDTISPALNEDRECDNETPFPTDGIQARFPPSFGIITTEMHEGGNWIALVSGTSWHLRRRKPDSMTDEFVRHEVRAKG